jgi:hypothetical protein
MMREYGEFLGSTLYLFVRDSNGNYPPPLSRYPVPLLKGGAATPSSGCPGPPTASWYHVPNSTQHIFVPAVPRPCPWTLPNPDRWIYMPDLCTLFSMSCYLAHKILGAPQSTPIKSLHAAFSLADRIVVEHAFSRCVCVRCVGVVVVDLQLYC